ncbi:MAG: hypothetical protein LBS98_01945 [Coriobacteriales bacterium]|nr:hypothetical protein [Coriobacteriales bacterium]
MLYLIAANEFFAKRLPGLHAMDTDPYQCFIYDDFLRSIKFLIIVF